MGSRWSRLLLSIVAILVGVALTGCDVIEREQPKQEVVIFAAASLTDALRDAGALFEKQHPVSVWCSFGSSGVLARQINQGAPADVYVSANPGWVAFLAEGGWVVEESRVTLLSNRLVVVQPDGHSRRLTTAEDLLQVSRLALGDTRTSPAGMYAKAFLVNRGLWPALEDRVVQAMNVRAALAYVERGEVEAGIVYASDAIQTEGVMQSFVIDSSQHPPVQYVGALVQSSEPSAAAGAFLDFLQSAEAGAVFRQHGFETF